MRLNHIIGGLIAAVVALGATSTATGQCMTSIDFEDQPAGSVITSDYEGVFFSVPGYTCPPELTVPALGTSSGTQALMVPACPEFSSGYLRMVFDDVQSLVRFTLGEWGTPDHFMAVRAYTTTSGGTPFYAAFVNGGNGVYRLVTIGSAGGPANIRRVEVETVTSGWFECIDDLEFGRPDTTPPVVQIHEPRSGGCFCGEIEFFGIACDPDGGYDRDRLEYRPWNAAPDEPWTLIDEVIGSPVCTPGFLYEWDTEDVGHGTYHVRAVATNACGMQGFDYVTMHIDKVFSTVDVVSPLDSTPVCGVVEFWGSIHDGCGCFDAYIVEYGLSPNGPFSPVDPSQPVYGQQVRNGLLATWDTTAMGLPNDTYFVRLIGIDTCGNQKEEILKLFLDDQSPVCGCPADINGDGEVSFSDLVSLLASWGPCF